MITDYTVKCLTNINIEHKSEFSLSQKMHSFWTRKGQRMKTTTQWIFNISMKNNLEFSNKQ